MHPKGHKLLLEGVTFYHLWSFPDQGAKKNRQEYIGQITAESGLQLNEVIEQLHTQTELDELCACADKDLLKRKKP